MTEASGTPLAMFVRMRDQVLSLERQLAARLPREGE